MGRKLPDTLQGRSIEIAMQRKFVSQEIDRKLPKARLEKLRRKCARWTQDHIEELRQAEPEIPQALNDRAADNWRTLLAIAEACSEKIAKRARAAACTLSAVNEEQNRGIMLLEDLRGLFERERDDRLVTTWIVHELVEMEARPWPEYRQGDHNACGGAVAGTVQDQAAANPGRRWR